MSQQLVDITSTALSMIETTDRWTTKVYARDTRGLECSPISEAACRWCALGALQRASSQHLGVGDPAWDAADAITRYLLEANGECDDPDVLTFEEQLAAINDIEGHAATVALFQQALSMMRGSLEGSHVR